MKIVDDRGVIGFPSYLNHIRTRALIDVTAELRVAMWATAMTREVELLPPNGQG